MLSAKSGPNSELYEQASARMNEILAPFNVTNIHNFYMQAAGNGITRERWSYELQAEGSEGYCSISPQLILDTNPGGHLELRVFVYGTQELLQGGLIGRLKKAFRESTGLALKVERDALQPTKMKQQESRGLAYAP